MHKIADVEIAKNIMAANDKLAHKNLHLLEDHNIFCVDFVGAIGSGKTALIEDLIDNLDEKVGVLAGDIISDFDADRIKSHNAPVVGLNTGTECHLDAHLVSHGLGDLPLDDIDYLFIENVGNLICPVDFQLGSHMRVVVVSVTEGDDTVEKHPYIFKDSDLIIINKIDLADAVGASTDKMVADAKKLNPDVKVITTSLKKGIGLDEVIEAIKEAKAHGVEHHHHHHDHDHDHDHEHSHEHVHEHGHSHEHEHGHSHEHSH